MSRSRRHNPVVTDQQRRRNVRFEKRLASKAARRADLQDGNLYRRVFNPWKICDYKGAAWWVDGYGMSWGRDDRRWWAK